MPTYDGPTLRAVRESMGVPLRRIARLAGMSHGHLSKVERGEYGRPVTPAIVSAYERVCQVNLGEAAAAVAEQQETQLGRRKLRTWRPGELSDMRRSAFTAAVCALSVGGWLQEPYGRLLDSTGRPLVPAPPDEIDVAQLEQLAQLATELDLRYGGGLVSQFTKALLRWAVLMLETPEMPKQISVPLHRAAAGLALRCAWSAFDCAAHEQARSLFRLGIYTAVRGGDRNLRAHAMAEVAAQHNAVGYPDDALEVLGIAKGDDRVAPQVRMVLQGVEARAHAALGDIDACMHSVEAIEAGHAGLVGQPDADGWVATLTTPARVHAAIGHALANLARKTGHSEADWVAEQARQRLTEAVDAFDATAQARAHALCVAQLAVLHLRGEQVEQGAAWGRLALLSAATVRSARLTHNIARIRGLAAKHADQTEAKALVEEIDAATGGDQV
jgi:transcriptional regulator with XRE-family HTH domain